MALEAKKISQLEAGQKAQSDVALSGYREYKAIFRSNGVNAPVVTVLKNTIGSDVLVTRSSTGTFDFVNSKFKNNKVFFNGIAPFGDGLSIQDYISPHLFSYAVGPITIIVRLKLNDSIDNKITIQTISTGPGSPTDGQLDVYGFAIDIIVFD